MTKFNYEKACVSPVEEVWIVDCLGGEGQQTGRALRDHILDIFLTKGLNANEIVIRCEVNSIEDLERVFSTIKNSSKKVLISVEGHGHHKKGLELPEHPKKYVSFSYLLERFYEITCSAGGDLTVIAGFCHSMNIINYLSPYDKKPLPMAFYYGFSGEVRVRDLQSEIAKVYSSLLAEKFPQQSEMKFYSEYEHINEGLIYGLSMVFHPDLLAKILPEKSLGITRNLAVEEARDLGVPRVFTKKKTNEMLRSHEAIEIILDCIMHDTDRKTKIIEAVKEKLATDAN